MYLLMVLVATGLKSGLHGATLLLGTLGENLFLASFAGSR